MYIQHGDPVVLDFGGTLSTDNALLRPGAAARSSRTVQSASWPDLQQDLTGASRSPQAS